MVKKNINFSKIRSIGIISGVLGFLVSFHTPLPAQQSARQPFSSAQLPQLPDRGAPIGRRRGGTSRSQCPALNMPLTALVPGEETTGEMSSSTALMASTIAEYPTFWVYIPKLPDNLRSGEFVIQNEAGENLYRTKLTLPKTAGTIGIKIPSNSQYSLKTDRKYHWYFKIFCNQEAEPSYIYVDAWVERVALSDRLKNQLQTNKFQHYRVYLDNNIWYDALTNLGDLRLKNPQNEQLKQEWSKILSSVGLSDLVQEPIVENK